MYIQHHIHAPKKVQTFICVHTDFIIFFIFWLIIITLLN